MSGELSRRSFLQSVGGGVLAAGALSDTGEAAGRERYVLGASEDASLSYLEEQVQTLVPSAAIVDRDEVLAFTVATVPASDEADLVDTFGSADTTRYVERDELLTPVTPSVGVSDVAASRSWAPERVRATEAWRETLGTDVTVAVVDTGVEYFHEDLRERFDDDKGHSLVDDDPSPDPDERYNRHGTNVAGVVAATRGNGEGIDGISNARLLSVKASGSSGGAYSSALSKSIRWAADNGADVINFSWGGGDSLSETRRAAVDHAVERGALVVAAAGNDGEDTINATAAYERTVGVTALDRDGDLASFSNYGPGTDLVAPGVDLRTTDYDPDRSRWGDGHGYASFTGTSASAPVVAGVAALALSVDPSLGPMELKQRLEAGARDIGLPVEKQGAGLVDALNVVDVADPGPDATLTVAPHHPDPREVITLDASDSSYPDGSIEAHEWDLGDGTTATGPVVEHSYGAPGEYAVELTVIGDDGDAATARETVTVGSASTVTVEVDVNTCTPVEDVEIVLIDETTDQRRRTRTDADGQARFLHEVDWCHRLAVEVPAFDKRDSLGCPEPGQTVNETFDVTDELDDGEAPAAALDTPEGPLTAGESYTFSGERSQDDAGIRAYSWRMGDGTRIEGEGSTVEHTYDEPGEYAVELEVVDCSWNTDTVEKEMTVEPNDGSDEPPEAEIETPGGPLAVGEAYTFSGKASSDSDGSIEAHEWDLGDGTTATGPTVEHSYDDLGEYAVELTVTDDDETTDTARASVRVTDANSAPTARVDAPDTISPNTTVTFDAAPSTDPDGTIVEYGWTPKWASGHRHGETYRHRFGNVSGEYTVELTVTDDDGATDTTRTTVTVEPDCHDRDPDCDGEWEDVNGDGETDVFDVRALLDNADEYDADRFDFNDDGEVNIVDAQALSTELLD